MTTKQDFNTRFEEAGREIDEMVGNAREEYREERQELKDKWNRLDERRKEVAGYGDDRWEEFKDELEETWNDVKMSYEDLRKRLAD